MDDQGTRDNNIRHEEALAQVEAFKKSGGKIKQGPVLIRKLEKSSINLPSRAKPKDEPVLAGLSHIEKFKVVLAKYKKLTRRQVMDLTGMGYSTVSSYAKKLEVEGVLIRDLTGNSDGKEVVFKLVEGK